VAITIARATETPLTIAMYGTGIMSMRYRGPPSRRHGCCSAAGRRWAPSRADAEEPVARAGDHHHPHPRVVRAYIECLVISIIGLAPKVLPLSGRFDRGGGGEPSGARANLILELEEDVRVGLMLLLL